jgi:2-keto-4-pentenoate hydratase
VDDGMRASAAQALSDAHVSRVPIEPLSWRFDGLSMSDAYAIQPRVEPEIDFVLPAPEIIDSRIRDRRIGILDTITENASSGGIVLGSTPVGFGVGDVDLRLSGCVIHRTGEVAGTGDVCRAEFAGIGSVTTRFTTEDSSTQGVL